MKLLEIDGRCIRRLVSTLSWQEGLLTCVVTDFLTGRSTRQEFETCLEPLISTTRNFIRYHNEILLTLLSNSFREAPPSSLQSLGWSKKRRELGDQRSRGDPAAKRLKSEVMGLTNRERARLKKIPKPDPSYRLRPNSMIETRFAKLPRVPVTQQKINSCKPFSLWPDLKKADEIFFSTTSYRHCPWLPCASSHRVTTPARSSILERPHLGKLPGERPPGWLGRPSPRPAHQRPRDSSSQYLDPYHHQTPQESSRLRVTSSTDTRTTHTVEHSIHHQHSPTDQLYQQQQKRSNGTCHGLELHNDTHN